MTKQRSNSLCSQNADSAAKNNRNQASLSFLIVVITALSYLYEKLGNTQQPLCIFEHKHSCLYGPKACNVHAEFYMYCILEMCLLYANHKQNWLIGCPKSTDDKPWHTATVVAPFSARVDIQYLSLGTWHNHECSPKRLSEELKS